MFNAFTPRSASAYQRINVETSMHTIDQHQLVSLLLEGLLQAVATARGALGRGDVPKKCSNITKAVRILEEGLMTSLDQEAGGEIAANLNAVYDYSVRRLIQANARNDDAMLQEVYRLIEPIFQAWKEVKKESHAANEGAQPVMAEA